MVSIQKYCLTATCSFPNSFIDGSVTSALFTSQRQVQGTDFNPLGVSNEPLRLAVVTETYPPEVNGVARTLSRLVDGLVDAGHSIRLIRPRQGAKETSLEPTSRGDQERGYSELLARGVPIPFYPELRMGLPQVRSFRRFWTTERPDVVHVATQGPLGWAAVRVARQLDIPVVSEFRTHFDMYCRHYGAGWLLGPARAYLRRFHNRTARTLAPTRRLAEELRTAGFRRVAVVGRGVDTDRFCPEHRSDQIRQDWGVDSETPVALYVGRLAPEKNLDQVIASYRTAQESGLKWRLIWVGDGPARARLQQECPDSIFMGMRHGHELAAMYASADVLWFPSVTETFGNVTLEAMASGLGVVAFRHAAAEELVLSGKQGWLVSPAESERFPYFAMESLVDVARLRRFGRAARMRALNCGWGAVVSKMEFHYRRAMADALVSSL